MVRHTGCNTAARLGSIKQPTVVVAGAADQTVPFAAKDALAQGIPGAQLLVFPESGHATPFDEPAAFNKAGLEFIAAD